MIIKFYDQRRTIVSGEQHVYIQKMALEIMQYSTKIIQREKELWMCF